MAMADRANSAALAPSEDRPRVGVPVVRSWPVEDTALAFHKHPLDWEHIQNTQEYIRFRHPDVPCTEVVTECAHFVACEAPGIDVTPEMIRVGLEELLLYSPQEDSLEFAEEIVERILRKTQALRGMK
jgi:hypothetical protein